MQYVKVVNDNTIQGWIKCTPACGGWGNGAGKVSYTVYFYAQFSKPLKKFGVWSVEIPDGWDRKSTDFYEWLKTGKDVNIIRNDSLASTAKIMEGCREMEGKQLGFYTEFATQKDEPVSIKSGISYASLDGAKKNLEAEIAEWDFNLVRIKARNLWAKELNKIDVEGGTEDQKVIFNTAMYRTLIDPRAMADVDGNYMGGDGQLHKTDKFTKRTIFSGWDVFRSQFPLQAIINPEMVNDMINSLTELAGQNGTHYYERWELLNAYSGCMIGNPAVSVIADAFNKGIRNFDICKAYEFARNTCEKDGNGELGHAYGISTTLEYAYFEWCLSQLADSLGHKEDAAKYLKRSQSYRNVFDPSVEWFRPRNKDGWEA